MPRCTFLISLPIKHLSPIINDPSLYSVPHMGTASIACDHVQDDMFYSAGSHGDLRLLHTTQGKMERVWKKWRWMDLRKGKSPCNGRNMLAYIFWPTLGSPWYNRTGWLGVKHQSAYLLTYSRLYRENFGQITLGFQQVGPEFLCVCSSPLRGYWHGNRMARRDDSDVISSLQFVTRLATSPLSPLPQTSCRPHT